MKTNPRNKLLLAAAIGLLFSAVGAQAQLNVDLHTQATFGPFVGGGGPNTVTSNGQWDTVETIRTGTPVAAPFTIVYTPTNLGANTITDPNDTLTTALFQFNSTIAPQNYFTQAAAVINYDFDNDSVIDLSQAYTISLSSFTAPNGFTGVSYSILPVQFFGSTTINGVVYAYASVVANSSGTLFDGSSTVAAIQFKFLALPVPEPSTYAAFGVAALGGIVWLRRRRFGLSALRS